MSKISAMLDVGKRSLMNNQNGLQTVGHNIANKNTDGYSRQRVEFQTGPPIGVGKLRFGTGAKTSAVARVNNPYLEKQLEKEEAQLGYIEGRADALSRIEQVYNEQINQGFNKHISEYFNSFRELSNNPESLAVRSLVKESANFLSQDFNRIDRQLRSVQGDIDQQIVTLVEEINQINSEIAQLNEKIQQVEVAGGRGNDERDRRDHLLKNLGERLNIRYAEGKGGKITVTSGNVVLVSGYSARTLSTSRLPEQNGKAGIFYHNTKESTPVNITGQINGGKLGGILDVRDKVAVEFIDSMNKMAYQLATETNRVHQMGFDKYGNKGVQFFELPQDVSQAASKIKVSRSIMNDVGVIVAADRENAPANNTIARIISNIQYKDIMDGGKSNIDDFYNGVVAKSGILSQRSRASFDSQTGIVNQLTQLRESVSGVNVDEEMTKMLEYQKGFDASARLIRTADEMLETVLTIKR